MKNTKTLKLLVMVLSLVLLMSAAIAVAVSAAEDDTYAIKSINISHDDSIMVLMAVDAVGVDPATIEVKYTIGNGEAKTAKYYKNVAIYKNLGDETEYPVFYTEGIPMKDMGEEVRQRLTRLVPLPHLPHTRIQALLPIFILSFIRKATFPLPRARILAERLFTSTFSLTVHRHRRFSGTIRKRTQTTREFP